MKANMSSFVHGHLKTRTLPGNFCRANPMFSHSAGAAELLV